MTKQEIINARTSARPYSSLDDTTRCKALEAVICRVYAMKGFSITEEVSAEVLIATKELDQRIIIRWPYLTTGEILLAFESGICGDYGTDKRLSVANYISWLNAYAKSDERREAMESINNRRPETKPQNLLPATDVERMNNQAIVNGLRKAWDSFKRSGELGVSTSVWGGIMADWLMKHGKMKPTPETFRRAALKHKKPSQDIADIINAGIASADSATKRELLEMYFKNLVDRNVEFTL